MKIRRFVTTIEARTGKTISQCDLDSVPPDQKIDLLQKVFTQGLERLGYQKTKES